MKAYTDLPQSKKLAEILPIVSADMVYAYSYSVNEYTTYPYPLQSSKHFDVYKDDIPCWSLSALLKELPETMLGKDNDGYVVMVETMGSGLTTFASNPVDACYEMIIKLKERNLI